MNDRRLGRGESVACFFKIRAHEPIGLSFADAFAVELTAKPLDEGRADVELEASRGAR